VTAVLNKSNFRIALLAAVAMLAFAANSLLCRLALGPGTIGAGTIGAGTIGVGAIDAASFASLRMVSGAVMLVAIVALRGRKAGGGPGNWFWGNWRSAAMLFLYMACFSFAYLSLGAGTGALILFGAVQLTMFAVARRGGERFSQLSWIGLAVAVLGLIYLVSPGLHAPDPLGALLMTVAGLAWGFYSLLGRRATDPLAATARNFVSAVPLVLLVSLGSWLMTPDAVHANARGVMLAIASGALASGCGYVVWYAVLPSLPAMRAATLQLSVPAIAALGGVLLLSEELTPRLLLASLATLGGVAFVLAQRARPTR
jgi:drug/metabolite transporter (DMT)-like permease